MPTKGDGASGSALQSRRLMSSAFTSGYVLNARNTARPGPMKSAGQNARRNAERIEADGVRRAGRAARRTNVLASSEQIVHRLGGLVERRLRRLVTPERQRDRLPDGLVDLRPLRVRRAALRGLELLHEHAVVARKVRAADEFVEHGHLPDLAHRGLRVLAEHELHELPGRRLLLGALEHHDVLTADDGN